LSVSSSDRGDYSAQGSPRRHSSDDCTFPARSCGDPWTDEQRWTFRLEEDALSLLCELDYPGNIRALRNLIFQLTSYVNENKPIPIHLVQFVLAKLLSPGGNYVAGISDGQLPSSDTSNCVPSATETQSVDQVSLQAFLSSIARDGDIVLPLELCVLRRDETFKQWTARAKRCTIETARQTTGGSMRSVAERLGLTRESLWSHLLRARRDQNEPLFDWEPQPD
jgi:DNA-binding NtrC family response regulator